MLRRMRICFWSASILLSLASSAVFAEPPRELPIEQIERGLSFTIRSPAQFIVARTPEQLTAAWRLLYTDAEGNITQPGWQVRYPLPQVDLARNMVVGIVLATHSNGCTGVRITSASILDTQIVVRYRERRLRTDVVEACPSTFTTGFDFEAIPANDLPVVFSEDQSLPNSPWR